MAFALPLDFVQVAHVVPDLDAACAEYHQLFGLGPFLAHRASVPGSYRGQPMAEPLTVNFALAQVGDLQLELIQQTTSGPAVGTDVFGIAGFNHVAVFSADYAADTADLASAGCPMVMEQRLRPSHPVALMDARASLGYLIEVYSEHPDLRRLYAEVRERTEQWDGRELIQPLRRDGMSGGGR